MSNKFYKESLTDPTYNATELANLCGVLHQNIHMIEKALKVRIQPGQDTIFFTGHNSSNVGKAKEAVIKLHPFAHEPISPQKIMSFIELEEVTPSMQHTIHLSRKVIHTRNPKQGEYLNGIDACDLNFAVGPAGTGKTYLAVAKAVEAFEKGEVQRLVFVRPAVEAGEKLGFLPGDLVEKVLPYLRPIYDALYEMIGFKEAQKLLQSDVIEVLPLAFMRGRTLNESFIILDEAQNTTIPQMKMFLTRIGFGSKTVVTGDVSQIDLPKGTDSGLIHATKILKDLNEIGMYFFTTKEVVRHPLVARIIDCYETVKDK